MKCNGDSLFLSPSLSLSLSLLFMHICAWQSADSGVTSDHCRVTVQWLFSKNFKLLETSKKRCLTVGRRSRDLRPLSRDRSVTFYKKNSNCLKRPKNVGWQSADGRVTSDHCRVNRSLTFFKKISNCLKRTKNVVWQSSNGRVTSDHCRVTFSDFFQNFYEKLETSKNVFWQSSNGRVTSDHCRVTFSDFFQKISEKLETSKKRFLTVIQRSRDLRPLSRDLQWLFSKFSRIAWNV